MHWHQTKLSFCSKRYFMLSSHKSVLHHRLQFCVIIMCNVTVVVRYFRVSLLPSSVSSQPQLTQVKEFSSDPIFGDVFPFQLDEDIFSKTVQVNFCCVDGGGLQEICCVCWRLTSFVISSSDFVFVLIFPDSCCFLVFLVWSVVFFLFFCVWSVIVF